MKRLQRTQQMLARVCAEHRRGFDAGELAVYLSAFRHNVSSDLNELWRDGLAVKENGRPVRFWDRGVYEQLRGTRSAAPGADTPPVATGHGGADAGARPGQAPAGKPAGDPLSQCIGAQESLRQPVEQAKAAVLYPPAGLHTLLVGATGVGKSHMAELMHGFGIAAGRFASSAPFVTLNCADYAANPGLLMAHLFGAVKGAYTGADKDRVGLVEQADGGMLFLDEVHRLPAEGQEMFFRLIDKGLYRRLGETGPERQASVMLVAATTERVDSALLRTFTRRIPMVIALPSLAERTAGERLRFIRQFLQSEAGKIGVDLVASVDALRMLLEYECLGNIGQLRNDIQLACARLFLNYLSQRREPLELVPAHLPEHLHRNVPPARSRNPEVDDLLRQIGGQLVVSKQAARPDSATAAADPITGPLSFYGHIEQQMQELQRQGIALGDAEARVRENVEQYFRDFVDQVRQRHQIQRQELSKIVGAEIIRAVERALLYAEDRLNRSLPERILYALALHVHASLERLSRGETPDYLGHLPANQTAEAEVAAAVVELLGRDLGCSLPGSDVALVTMLLGPEDEESLTERQVGIVVMAHGRGVASGMVEVAHTLSGVSLATAVDMPLDEEPASVEEKLIVMAHEGRFPGGLLLMVDMGSLETMGMKIGRQSGIEVRTISMVSSPLVVEAVHQASIPGATLDQVYQAVLISRGLMLGHDSGEGLPQVVLTFCFTGMGSAHTLAKIVKEVLPDHARRVEVIAGSIGAGAGWNRLVATLVQSHRLLAVVGPINPRIPGIPYVSTEAMVVGQGGERLRRLVEESTGFGSHQEPDRTATLFAQMAQSLGEHLKVTNPAATIPVIAKGLNAIEQYLGQPLSDELRVGLMMHLVCLVDRKVHDRLAREESPAGPAPEQAEIPSWLPRALQEVTDMFHIHFDPGEYERLDEIIRESVSLPS